MGRKWNNIKEKKGEQDRERSQIYTKLLREVTKATKNGGAETDANFMLRIALEKCRKYNVPKDNIDRAIKKGLGAEANDDQDINYEGYGPGGVAVFVEASTNNVTRTVAVVRNFFNKCGGALGTTGSLQFVFAHKAVFEIPQKALKNMSEDDFTLEIIDAGAEDVVADDGYYTVTAPKEFFGAIQHKLDELKIAAEEAALERVPLLYKENVDIETFKGVMKLISLLESDDDVTHVYHNIEYREEFAQL